MFGLCVMIWFLDFLFALSLSGSCTSRRSTFRSHRW